MTRTREVSAELDQVRRTMGRFVRSFAAPAVDVQTLIELWDSEYADPVYQPEELAGPLRSWEEIRAYFERLPKHINGVRDVQPLDFRVDLFGGFAYGYARASASLEIVRRAEPLHGKVRQTFVLRRRDGDWRLIHYHESRLTPGLEDSR